MTDTLTVLTSSNNRKLAKIFRGQQLNALSFKPGAKFSVEELAVRDLESLADTIHKLEQAPTKTIIRGTFVGSNADNTTKSRQDFVSKPRSWCMIDIDSLNWDGDPQDQRAMLDHAVSELPKEFQQADCWYHFSSNMGIKAGIRVHLWYWLERPCSDDEMKTWLGGRPVDLRIFDPVQIHLTTNPQFVDGAIDPYPTRSGFHRAGNGVQSVPVPNDLATRTVEVQTMSKPRAKNRSGILDPAEIIRDPETGLVIDGREQLMFRLSNEIMLKLVNGKKTPSVDEVTNALWARFREEADLSVVSDRGVWTINDARTKAQTRLREVDAGTYSFVARSDNSTLVAGSQQVKRPTLVSATDAQSQLEGILNSFFEQLADGNAPRAGIRLTMGAGKTRKTIDQLKQYLKDREGQSVEVYVPRHDLGSEWEKNLIDINANVIHVYPRTGGQWDEAKETYPFPILCQRSDYVRDLEAKGHSIYSNACLSRTSGKQCAFFGDCSYLNQFRDRIHDAKPRNTVRIYTHASLFLSRNEFERRRTPDLVIIDEAFLSSAVSNLPSVSSSETTQHVRSDGLETLGFELLECLSNNQGQLSYLRDKDIGASDFQSVSLGHLRSETPFDADVKESRNVGSAKIYQAMQLLIDVAAREIEDQGRESFEQLVYDKHSNEIVICEHKPIRIPAGVPVLYLDATADPIITEPYLPNLEYHRIDARQLAVVSQVHDRTGSNSFWDEKITQETKNRSADTYNEQSNDLAKLIVVLNEWAKAGESPLLVGHKKLCDFLRKHPKLDQGVAVAHFMSLRGSDEYQDRSVIFITGRNQPPPDAIDRQARAIFGASGYTLKHDDLEELPFGQADYRLSERSSHQPSGITLRAFSDPRIEAVQRQIRDAETVQAIARLRLVWAEHQKRVFLLSNLPVEMPVDHLVSFSELMPERLELELIKQGDVPLTALGLEKMRPDLELNEAAITKMVQRSNASDPKRMVFALPDLVKATTQIARFKAGSPRMTKQQHLFLPKDFEKRLSTALFSPWTQQQVLEHLETYWGMGNVHDLTVEFLFIAKPQVSAK